MSKDGLSNSVGDVVPNLGSPLQAGCPVMPRADPDMVLKVCLVHANTCLVKVFLGYLFLPMSSF